MPHEVYMSTGKPTEPLSEMEMLDRDWLNGGLALIRAFTKAAAENNGFTDVSVSHTPFNSRTPECLSLIINFSTAKIQGCRNARPKRIDEGLSRFERDILDINGALDRNLRKKQSPDDIQYTMPLSRHTVPDVTAAIKEKMAQKLPVSAYIAQLESPKR